jgi:hypothetical protein
MARAICASKVRASSSSLLRFSLLSKLNYTAELTSLARSTPSPTEGERIMTWKPLTRYCWIEIILALGCAAACGDDSGGPPPNMTAAGGTQPSGSAGTTNGAGGSPAEAGTGGMPGASGTDGAGEAPGMDPELDVGGMVPVDGANGGAAGAGMDPDCATGATDTDGDGTPDCDDGCAEDPNKLAAGACGCGVLDSDIDFDGALDCQEM